MAEKLPDRPYLGRGDRIRGNLSTFGRIPRIDVKCPNWTGPVLSNFQWKRIVGNSREESLFVCKKGKAQWKQEAVEAECGGADMQWKPAEQGETAEQKVLCEH